MRPVQVSRASSAWDPLFPSRRRPPSAPLARHASPGHLIWLQELNWRGAADLVGVAGSDVLIRCGRDGNLLTSAGPAAPPIFARPGRTRPAASRAARSTPTSGQARHRCGGIVAARTLAHGDEERAQLRLVRVHAPSDARPRGHVFFTCDRVMKTRTGVAKERPTFLKTQRVLRLALVWAQDAGLIERAPLPEDAATY